MPNEEMLTTGKVARALGVSLNTVKSWIREGKIGALKLPSGHYRVARSEVERLIENGRAGAVPPSSTTSRSRAWQEYEEWKQAQPALQHRLSDVLAWVDSMLRLARSHGALPEASIEEKATRVRRLHEALARIKS